MVSKRLVNQTIWFSLFVQIVTGIVSLHGLFITLNKKDKILHSILQLESLVQFVEMVFYIWIAYAVMNIDKMASRRYIDWIITTPTMLISTIMYMKYTELRDNDKLEKTELNAENFVSENTSNITSIVVYNLFMLFFGYLGEAGYLSKYISIPIGFGFFIKSFQTIYNDYAVKSDEGIKLFTFMFSIWSLYGVAAALPANAKNTSYNILDIIAKNFYGLYIYYTIYKVSLQN